MMKKYAGTEKLHNNDDADTKIATESFMAKKYQSLGIDK